MEFLDNAGTISIFGTTNAASEAVARDVTGYQGQILGMSRSEQILVRAGEVPERVARISYLLDREYEGLWDANPFHQTPLPAQKQQRAGHESWQGGI